MIITVNGFEEAKNYPVMFNTSVLLMDKMQDKFYVKSVDNLGKMTIETYEFHKVENQLPLTPDNFVSKQQFDQLSNKIDTILAALGGNTNEQHISEHKPEPKPTNRPAATSAVRKDVQG